MDIGTGKNDSLLEILVTMPDSHSLALQTLYIRKGKG